MTKTKRSPLMLTLLTISLSLLALHSMEITQAQKSGENTKPGLDMVLLITPKTGEQINLLSWDKARTIHSMTQPETLYEGICIHCNIPMKFKGSQITNPCGVCGCGAGYGECLTGKASGKNGAALLLQDLPRGVSLHVEFMDSDKPELGIKHITVNLRSILLPLEKPLEMTDTQFLALIKPLGVRAVERADGDKLLRLTLKEDWNPDRANRLTKSLTGQGILLNYSPASPASF